MNAKVVHCKRSPYDIYIGRGSVWGNPYSHKEGTQALYIVADREAAIEAYRTYLQGNHKLLSRLGELKDKVLGCWCAPLACHGDVLVEEANKC